MFKGIDISKYQGEIDFSKVKKDVDFVIIRVGFTGYGSGDFNLDPKFKQNVDGCVSNNIPFGFYWFSQAINTNEAAAEADFVISNIKNYKPKYPIFIDSEYSGASNNSGRADSLSTSERTAIVKTFCETVESYGFYSGYYCSRSWSITKLEPSKLVAFDFWVADWGNYSNGNKPSTVNSYGIWQYSNSGSCSGISGRVDMNYSYKDYPSIIVENNLNGFGSVENTLKDITVTDISKGDVEKFKQLAIELKVENNFKISD